MRTLVIVDVQQDFYSKSGKLYVEGGGRKTTTENC